MSGVEENEGGGGRGSRWFSDEGSGGSGASCAEGAATELELGDTVGGNMFAEDEDVQFSDGERAVCRSPCVIEEIEGPCDTSHDPLMENEPLP